MNFRKYSHKLLFQSLTVIIICYLCNGFENKTESYNKSDNHNYVENIVNKYNQEFNVSNISSKNFDYLSDISLNESSRANLSDPYSIIFTELFDNRNNSEYNETLSESRTLSSWLGLNKFRKPQFLGRPHVRPHMPPPQQQVMHPIMSPHILPNFMPRPDGFPQPHDSDSVLLPPSMFEESGIKYWLKFIEEGGSDDSFDDSNPYTDRVNTRLKNTQKFRIHSKPKPIEIGEKPDEEEEELEPEMDDKKSNHNEPKSSNSHSSSSHEKYDTSPRCDRFTDDICIDDFEYPEQAIVDEIYKRRDIFELMYSEVRDNSPLVDGIPRDVEESYSYDYFMNDNKDTHSSGSEFGSSGDRSASAGFVCPSEVLYGKPKLARNKKGDWKVIVNAAEFTQTVRMEKCNKPNKKCNFISYPDYESRCAQVHSFHRLLVFEKGKGFYIDTFRIPTACSCHVNRKVSYKPLPSDSDIEKYEKKTKPTPALSNTLWSILGGNIPNSGSNPISQQQDLIRNQINLLQQLKHFPQLAHVSPENVIQQLMDFQSNTQSLPSPQKSFQNLHNLQNSASMTYKHQSLPMGNMDYLLPAIMVNEEPNKQMNRQQRPRPITQISHSPGTTTFVNPNGNGAPVVQVIHVPVSAPLSHAIDPSPVYKHQNPSYSDYSYLDANTLFYKKKQSPDEMYSDEMPINMDNFRPMLLQMQSRTNSSLMSPTEESDGDEKDYESSISIPKNDSELVEEVAKKRRGTVHNEFNKKINFSYHPILEYLSN